MASTFNIYEENCPTRRVLDRLADKWSLLVLDRLKHEPVRFNHLKRDIKGISQKTLSQTLKKLERDGLISRTVHSTVPVMVDYAMTPLGITLKDTVAAIAHWAEHHMDSVLEAQKIYDGALATR